MFHALKKYFFLLISFQEDINKNEKSCVDRCRIHGARRFADSLLRPICGDKEARKKGKKMKIEIRQILSFLISLPYTTLF